MKDSAQVAQPSIFSEIQKKPATLWPKFEPEKLLQTPEVAGAGGPLSSPSKST